MRIIIGAIALALGAAVATSANAAAPSFAKCETLSAQRGAGPAGPGTRNHKEFMADCLAGKIPEAAGTPTPRQVARAQSYDHCEDLAEQRGSGSASPGGYRNHAAFIDACMAGKVR